MIFNRVKLLMLLLITAMAANAEESLRESPFSASLELSTKYMWRGIEYGTAPTVFPMIGYGYKGFNAFAMGAYAVNGSHQEVDLGVSYSNSGFTIGVSDYYYPSAVGEKDGNCFSFSSIQRSNTYDCAKRGTYKMRWLHADQASSKCDYQSSCRSVFICCLAS